MLFHSMPQRGHADAVGRYGKALIIAAGIMQTNASKNKKCLHIIDEVIADYRFIEKKVKEENH